MVANIKGDIMKKKSLYWAIFFAVTLTLLASCGDDGSLKNEFTYDGIKTSIRYACFDTGVGNTAEPPPLNSGYSFSLSFEDTRDVKSPGFIYVDIPTNLVGKTISMDRQYEEVWWWYICFTDHDGNWFQHNGDPRDPSLTEGTMKAARKGDTNEFTISINTLVNGKELRVHYSGEFTHVDYDNYWDWGDYEDEDD